MCILRLTTSLFIIYAYIYILKKEKRILSTIDYVNFSQFVHVLNAFQ